MRRLDATAYIDALNRIQREFIASASRLDLNAKELPAFKRALDGLDPLLLGLIGALDRISPPKAVEDDHARLIASLRASQRSFAANADGLLSNDRARVQRSARAIADAIKQFTGTFDAALSSISGTLTPGANNDRDTP